MTKKSHDISSNNFENSPKKVSEDIKNQSNDEEEEIDPNRCNLQLKEATSHSKARNHHFNIFDNSMLEFDMNLDNFSSDFISNSESEEKPICEFSDWEESSDWSCSTIDLSQLQNGQL